MDILDMGLSELLALRIEDVVDFLTIEELLHMAEILGACWRYDMERARQGNVGMHVELPSGYHSDTFLALHVLLEQKNILKIIAAQMVLKMRQAISDGKLLPSCVVGVPHGATLLAEEISNILGVPWIRMDTRDGAVWLAEPIEKMDAILLVNDALDRWAGFQGSFRAIRRMHPDAQVMPLTSAVFNRGEQNMIRIEGVGDFFASPIVGLQTRRWNPKRSCLLCNLGSQVVPFSEIPDNWETIKASQKQTILKG